MPPHRWLEPLKPDFEPLGELLKRLRLERGWTQYDLAAQLEPDRASNAQAMKSLQTRLSRYESDESKRSDDFLLERLETLYGLSEGTLSAAASRTRRFFDRRSRLFGNSVAIPAEPELIEAVQALFLYEPEEIPEVTVLIRKGASPMPPRRPPQEETG